MPTERKAQQIEGLVSALGAAPLVVLTDYRGLTVADLQALRTQLRGVGGQFQVAKNTLTRIAAEQVGITGLEPMLEGPLGLGFAGEDIVGFSKAISDFAKSSRVLTVRGGVMDGRYIDAASIDALSTMPSREVLQSKFLGLLKAPMRQTVTVLSAPNRSLVYALNARAGQMDGSPASAAD